MRQSRKGRIEHLKNKPGFLPIFTDYKFWNIKVPNEKLTRKEIIDYRLKSAGWIVTDRTQVIEEFIISVENNVANEPRASYSLEFSDYVLLGKDGKPLAVVEAKKTSVDGRVGEEQAKQYAYNIQKQFSCDLPFCMYTKGHDIYFWDLEN